MDKRPGDRGMTSLSGHGMVSKADERIELIGSLEELSCYIGILKTDPVYGSFSAVLERIQHALKQTSEGIKAQHNRTAVPEQSEIAFLEQEIERMRTEAGKTDETSESSRAADTESLPGIDRTTAQIAMAAAVARRTERALTAVDRRFGVRSESKQYLNRLSSYFDQMAVWYSKSVQENCAAGMHGGREAFSASALSGEPEQKVEYLVRKVLNRLSPSAEITLAEAKILMEAVEEEAQKRGMNAVICICNAHGNPIAVHVMDGAFLVSFDAAQKKAYSAAAVKMPTLELARLAAPGGTFYGVDRLDGGKITLIGGGVPLVTEGNLRGAVGISGGTGEEDHSLALYAMDFYAKMC